MRDYRTALAGVLLWLAAAATAFAPWAAAGQAQRDRQRAERFGRTRLQPGTQAPDFELARLTIEKGQDGTPVGKISKEKVKLSAYRGKKVVCIFSSSYT